MAPFRVGPSRSDSFRQAIENAMIPQHGVQNRRGDSPSRHASHQAIAAWQRFNRAQAANCKPDLFYSKKSNC